MGEPKTVEAWWDRRSRNWVVQLLDERGYQVGDATYVYSKPEAMREKERMEREHGIRQRRAGMTHYRLAPYKPSNNVAAQWADWYEEGHYFLDELVYVPIDKIRFEKWNEQRYEFYMDAFRNGKAAQPVRLGRPWQGGDWYEVGDGNHRVAASKEMGYTHVPAIVSRKVEEKPRGVPPRNLYEEVYGRELNLVLVAVRARIPSNGWLYEEWGGTSPDGYWFKVSDERTRPDYSREFRVRADGDLREADFEWKGERMRYRGDKDGMVKRFSEMMSKVVEEGERRVAGDRLGRLAARVAGTARCRM